MSDWSPEAAIAMEKRHLIRGEEMIAHQERIISQLTMKGLDEHLPRANDLLNLMRQTLEMTRERLRDLENRYGKPSS